MIVLGIETSCDETAAAIVRDDKTILSNIVLSQIEEHAVFGGVVPEIAARAHVENIDKVIQAALDDAGISCSDLDGVAATCGPGLIGGVMIGMMSAKAIAATQDIPFVAVNHLEGHALTARLAADVAFPYLVLLVSGGHTQLLIAEGVGQYRRLGTTLDDAVGECFDKSAKLMGLPYPGGPHVETMAAQCTAPADAIKRFPLPSPMKGRKNCDFSFSGLKTAIRLHTEAMVHDGDIAHEDVVDLCYAFQNKIAEILADRCKHAITKYVDTSDELALSFVVCGGVAANKTICTALEQLAQRHNIAFHAPPLFLSGDNGAMIAWAGVEKLQHGQSDNMDFKARPRWPLDPDAAPKIGAGVKA